MSLILYDLVGLVLGVAILATIGVLVWGLWKLVTGPVEYP